ncbi:unnamed protein product [Notodromas monacha]|uniref:Uncharacterized protein n=1 Tax=Notodromas monacha TaxID=399045 RepID=A0A7R9GDB2_9CRUS|nr:unnamed protein product [Notodromas monacha]CAG0918369.1 unnamed protein product [Notodromas monacha]
MARQSCKYLLGPAAAGEIPARELRRLLAVLFSNRDESTGRNGDDVVSADLARRDAPSTSVSNAPLMFFVSARKGREPVVGVQVTATVERISDDTRDNVTVLLSDDGRGGVHFSSQNAPLMFFVSARKGREPVVGVQVTATVERISDDTRDNVTVLLSDDGRGDPDVTGNDGIYSGYFTEFLRTSGQYRVRISAVREGESGRFFFSPDYSFLPASGFIRVSIVGQKR